MSNLRFLLDENLPPIIRRELRQREPQVDVLRIGDVGAPMLGTPDEAILQWIEETGYLLVTDNRRSMPTHLEHHYAQGNHIPGILLIRRGTSIGNIIAELLLMWHASESAEYRDRIQFIPL